MSHPSIRSLDRQLARKGEPVVLSRFVRDGEPIEVTAMAFCRGADPHEITGGIMAAESTVIMSPTEMQAAGWPAPPQLNDRVTYDGRTRAVIAAAAVTIGGETVRYDIRVSG